MLDRPRKGVENYDTQNDEKNTGQRRKIEFLAQDQPGDQNDQGRAETGPDGIGDTYGNYLQCQ